MTAVNKTNNVTHAQVQAYEMDRLPGLPVSKEKVIKSLLADVRQQPRFGNIKPMSTDNTTYIDLCGSGNLNTLIRMMTRSSDGDVSTTINLGKLNLPLMIHAPDIDIAPSEDGSGVVNIELESHRKITLLVSDVGDKYLVQFYAAVAPRNVALLMDMYYLDKETNEIKSVAHEYDTRMGNTERDRQALHFTTLHQVTTLCLLGVISKFEWATLPAPSKLKLRNVKPMQQKFHQPYIVLPVTCDEVISVEDMGVMYNPRTIMNNFLKSMPMDKEFYEGIMPFLMTFDDTPVHYTPMLFKYLPFNKFILIDNNFLPTNGGRFFVAYEDGIIRAGLTSLEASFEILHVNIKHIVNTDNGINVTKFTMVSNELAKPERKHEDGAEKYAVSLVNSLLAFLTHYANLTPRYHEEPTEENQYKLHQAMDVEVMGSRRLSVIKLLSPRKLRYRGHLGGTHASPEEHKRIGHWRTYKSGKRTYVEETTVNKGKGKAVNKIYVVE